MAKKISVCKVCLYRRRLFSSAIEISENTDRYENHLLLHHIWYLVVHTVVSAKLSNFPKFDILTKFTSVEKNFHLHIHCFLDKFVLHIK